MFMWRVYLTCSIFFTRLRISMAACNDFYLRLMAIVSCLCFSQTSILYSEFRSSQVIVCGLSLTHWVFDSICRKPVTFTRRYVEEPSLVLTDFIHKKMPDNFHPSCSEHVQLVLHRYPTFSYSFQNDKHFLAWSSFCFWRKYSLKIYLSFTRRKSTRRHIRAVICEAPRCFLFFPDNGCRYWKFSLLILFAFGNFWKFRWALSVWCCHTNAIPSHSLEWENPPNYRFLLIIVNVYICKVLEP